MSLHKPTTWLLAVTTKWVYSTFYNNAKARVWHVWVKSLQRCHERGKEWRWLKFKHAWQLTKIKCRSQTADIKDCTYVQSRDSAHNFSVKLSSCLCSHSSYPDWANDCIVCVLLLYFNLFVHIIYRAKIVWLHSQLYVAILAVKNNGLHAIAYSMNIYLMQSMTLL